MKTMHTDHCCARHTLGQDQVRRLAQAAPCQKLNRSDRRLRECPQEIFYSLIVSSFIGAFWLVAVVMAVIAKRRTRRHILQRIGEYLAQRAAKKE